MGNDRADRRILPIASLLALVASCGASTAPDPPDDAAIDVDGAAGDAGSDAEAGGLPDAASTADAAVLDAPAATPDAAAGGDARTDPDGAGDAGVEVEVEVDGEVDVEEDESGNLAGVVTGVDGLPIGGVEVRNAETGELLATTKSSGLFWADVPPELPLVLAYDLPPGSERPRAPHVEVVDVPAFAAAGAVAEASAVLASPAPLEVPASLDVSPAGRSGGAAVTPWPKYFELTDGTTWEGETAIELTTVRPIGGDRRYLPDVSRAVDTSGAPANLRPLAFFHVRGLGLAGDPVPLELSLLPWQTLFVTWDLDMGSRTAELCGGGTKYVVHGAWHLDEVSGRWHRSQLGFFEENDWYYFPEGGIGARYFPGTCELLGRLSGYGWWAIGDANPGAGCVRGRVVGADGEAVGGARVDVVDLDGARLGSVVTAASGEFCAATAGASRIRLQARAMGEEGPFVSAAVEILDVPSGGACGPSEGCGEAPDLALAPLVVPLPQSSECAADADCPTTLPADLPDAGTWCERSEGQCVTRLRDESELLLSLQRIFRGVVLHTRMLHLDEAGEPLPCRFPATQAPTPVEQTCCSTNDMGGPDAYPWNDLCDADPDVWTTMPWSDAAFSMGGEHRFVYGLEPLESGLRIAAEADGDCDSVYRAVAFDVVPLPGADCELEPPSEVGLRDPYVEWWRGWPDDPWPLDPESFPIALTQAQRAGFMPPPEQVSAHPFFEEVSQNLAALAGAAAAVFEATCAFPPPAGLTPVEEWCCSHGGIGGPDLDKDNLCDAGSGDWSAEGWTALGFSIAGEHAFVYETSIAPPDASGTHLFRASAHADVDCDYIPSTWTRFVRGTTGPDGCTAEVLEGYFTEWENE